MTEAVRAIIKSIRTNRTSSSDAAKFYLSPDHLRLQDQIGGETGVRSGGNMHLAAPTRHNCKKRMTLRAITHSTSFTSMKKSIAMEGIYYK